MSMFLIFKVVFWPGGGAADEWVPFFRIVTRLAARTFAQLPNLHIIITVHNNAWEVLGLSRVGSYSKNFEGREADEEHLHF